MICRKRCDGKSIVKNLSLIDEKGKVIAWKLCPICFNLWANNEFGKLIKRIKTWKK